MSNEANAVLEQIRKLPPSDQQQILSELQRQVASQTEHTADSIRSARGLFAGGELTKALLVDRAEERRRG